MPRANARRPAPHVKVKARRASYDVEFKTHVVQTALQRPANNRIKPTCAHRLSRHRGHVHQSC